MGVFFDKIKSICQAYLCDKRIAAMRRKHNLKIIWRKNCQLGQLTI
ncbi:MAG: hypothetical protein HEEMFOPI_01710 [Holosporales bacterium]